MNELDFMASANTKILTDVREFLPNDLFIEIVDANEIPEALKPNTGRPAPAVRGWKNMLLRHADRDLPIGNAIVIRLQSSSAARVLRNELATISKSARCSLNLKLRGSSIYILRRQTTIRPEGVRDNYEALGAEQVLAMQKQLGKDRGHQIGRGSVHSLEVENSRLKRLVADLMLKKESYKDPAAES